MTRKIIRNYLRSSAVRHGKKPSRHVHAAWDDLQCKRYGSLRRRINQAKGTAQKRKWRNRIEAVV